MNKEIIELITWFLEAHDVMAWKNQSKLSFELNKFGLVITISDDQKHPTDMDELIDEMLSDFLVVSPTYTVKVEKLNGFTRLITIT